MASFNWPPVVSTGSGITSLAITVPSVLSVSPASLSGPGTFAFTYSGTALPVANGGTGLTALTAGYAVIGNGTSAASLVAPGTSGNVLTSNGSAWISQAATTGFTNPMTTLGDLIYENATPAPTRLAGNTTSTKNFLVQTGTGTVSAAPTWGTIAAGDVPTLNQNTTGTAANITATTNGTLTSITSLSLPATQVTGLIAATGATTTPTATTISEWDANKNMSANNHLEGFTSIATAAGTTTLVVGSTYTQVFTGSTTQTCVLPVATTLVNGLSFAITNLSTGVVTVQTSGGNTIQAMAANTNLILTCINTAGGTGTASWDWVYSPAQSAALAIAQGGTGSTTQNFVDLSSTQTAAGAKTFSTAPTFSSLSTAGVLLNSAAGLVSSSAGPLAVTNGGTGSATALTQYGVIYASTTTAEATTAAGTTGQVLTATTSAAPAWVSLPGSFYYSGYQIGTWTTSGTMGDGTNSGGNTLTQRYASGLTVTAGASNVAGITFTPASATAVYLIKVNTSMYAVGGGGVTWLNLTDGTIVLDSRAAQNGGTGGTWFPTTFTSIYAPASTSAKTVKIQIQNTAGASSAHSGNANGEEGMEWTIVRLV